MISTTATETLRLLEAYSEARDRHARDQLVANYEPLVRKICRRFRRSSTPQEDLFQVGLIGLLNAIERFDSRYGASFSSLAIPEVLGCILNHLRDHGSLMKVPRGLRRKKLMVDRVSEGLAPHLGHWPTVSELAQACELPEEDIHAALELGHAGNPRSLDESLNVEGAEESVTLSDFVGRDDKGFDLSLDRMTLEAALDTLPVREKTILILRFYQGMSQRQTAERVEVSQMHVSRLERSALMKLRLIVQNDGAATRSHPLAGTPV